MGSVRMATLGHAALPSSLQRFVPLSHCPFVLLPPSLRGSPFRFNHSAGDSAAGVAGGIGLQVVRTGMDDDGLAEQVVGAAERRVFDDHFQAGVALGIGLEVAEVADVLLLRVRSGVLVAGGVVMGAGAGEVAVAGGAGPAARASVTSSTVSSDVKSTRGRIRISRYRPEPRSAFSILPMT